MFRADEFYTSLDVETRIVVQQRTGEIRTLMRRTAQDIIEIGQKLIEVKARLGHGLFGAWLQVEFEWTDRTARRFMAVAEVFKSDTVSVLANVDAKALYLLATPSAPESARKEVLQQAESGEHITYGRAREIIGKHTQASSGHQPGSEPTQVKAERHIPCGPVPPAQRDLDSGKPLTLSFQRGKTVDHATESPLTAFRAEEMLLSADVPISETPGYDSDEWYTPAEYIEAARAVMGDIDLDPATCAAAQDVIRAGTVFTKDDDGLIQPWHGRVWLNPPYSAALVQGFVDKLCAEYDAGRLTEAVVLVNNATDTAWFHSLLARFPACVLRRRVPFWRPGFSGGGARQGQVIFYLGPNPDRFQIVFARFGVVVAALRDIDTADGEG